MGFLFSWTEAATPLVAVTSFCVLAGPLAYALAMRARDRRERPPPLASAKGRAELVYRHCELAEGRGAPLEVPKVEHA